MIDFFIAPVADQTAGAMKNLFTCEWAAFNALKAIDDQIKAERAKL